jgi:hypothetical protein
MFGPVRHSIRARSSGWRTYSQGRYRPFHGIAIGQSFVGALASDAIFVPLLLALGASGAFVMFVGALPAAGSALQGLFPALLRRANGDLRRLTLLFACFELRGLVIAAIVGAVALGALPPDAAVIAIAVVVAVGQTAGIISGANIAAWTAAVLPDKERRLVGPRTGAIAVGLSAVLLLPAARLVDARPAGAARLWMYAALTAIGGTAALLTLVSVRHLPRPGRIRVPLDAAGAKAPVPFREFLRVSVLNSAGGGLVPYLGVYAITILHCSPGFVIMLAGLNSLASLVASLSAGAFLAGGSASRLHRASFIARAAACGICLAAFPGNGTAPLLLAAGSVLFAVGYSTGTLAQNERLFRMVSGPSIIACQGKFLAANGVAQSAGSMVTAAALAVSQSYPVYAVIFVSSAAARVVASAAMNVSPTWHSAPTAAAASEPEVAARRSIGA